MKKIFIIISGIILFVIIAICLSYKQINYYMEQGFYADASTIVNSFQFQVLSGTYNPSRETKYITLNKADVNISPDTIDLTKSYIAFKLVGADTKYYITLIGKGKYRLYAYRNVDSTKLSNLSKISLNRNINTTELLKEINASKY